MQVPNYFSNVVIFCIVGIILGLILDIFRSIRKLKKSTNLVVAIQDVIYFVIIFIIMTLAIYFFLDDDIRVYIIMSILSGLFIYYKFFSKFVMVIYSFILKKIGSFLRFVFLPFKFIKNVHTKIFANLYKFVKKCCIKIFNVIPYLCKKVIMLPKFKQKKKVKYEESSGKSA